MKTRWENFAMTPFRIAGFGLIALLVAPASHAASKAAPFDSIQTECVRSGELSAGAMSRSASCRVTKGRWFSTIEHDDFYQAQYCLQDKTEATTCRQRAANQLLPVARRYLASHRYRVLAKYGCATTGSG